MSNAQIGIKLPEGTSVVCKVQGVTLYGTICGLAGVEQPFIGHTYIVQLDAALPGYPYTCCAVPGVCVEIVDTTKTAVVASNAD